MLRFKKGLFYMFLSVFFLGFGAFYWMAREGSFSPKGMEERRKQEYERQLAEEEAQRQREEEEKYRDAKKGFYDAEPPLEGKVYYDKGEKVHGWLNQNGRWYYFRENTGTMVTGWQYINDHWYYFRDSGTRVNKWQYIDGGWKYFSIMGRLQTGWKSEGTKYYYLDPETGNRVTGERTIDGKTYVFGEDGVLISHERPWGPKKDSSKGSPQRPQRVPTRRSTDPPRNLDGEAVWTGSEYLRVNELINQYKQATDPAVRSRLYVSIWTYIENMEEPDRSLYEEAFDEIVHGWD